MEPQKNNNNKIRTQWRIWKCRSSYQVGTWYSHISSSVVMSCYVIKSGATTWNYSRCSFAFEEFPAVKTFFPTNSLTIVHSRLETVWHQVVQHWSDLRCHWWWKCFFETFPVEFLVSIVGSASPESVISQGHSVSVRTFLMERLLLIVRHLLASIMRRARVHQVNPARGTCLASTPPPSALAPHFLHKSRFKDASLIKYSQLSA